MRTLEHLRQIPCRHCGKEFRQEFNNRYCSDECRKAKWNAYNSSMRKAITKAKVITRTCAVCQSQFSFTPLRGTTSRKFCSPECRNKSGMQQFVVRNLSREQCRIEGCEQKATRVREGLCEKHYMRKRRHGGTHILRARTTKHNYQGYVFLREKHPLTRSDGLVAEHRKVAYDQHSGVCPPCHWCGDALSWRDAVVDHLNEIKHDNDPRNLAVCCNHCNRMRGCLDGFAKRLTRIGALRYIELLRKRLNTQLLACTRDKAG